MSDEEDEGEGGRLLLLLLLLDDVGGKLPGVAFTGGGESESEMRSMTSLEGTVLVDIVTKYVACRCVEAVRGEVGRIVENCFSPT